MWKIQQKHDYLIRVDKYFILIDSKINIHFDPPKIATKGILTDPGRVEGPLKRIKSFFQKATKMAAKTY